MTGKESGHHVDPNALEVVPGAKREKLEGWVPGMLLVGGLSSSKTRSVFRLGYFWSPSLRRKIALRPSPTKTNASCGIFNLVIPQCSLMDGTAGPKRGGQPDDRANGKSHISAKHRDRLRRINHPCHNPE